MLIVDLNNKIIIEVFAEYWKKKFWGSLENYKKIRINQFKDFKIFFFNQKQVYSKNFLNEVKKCWVD